MEHNKERDKVMLNSIQHLMRLRVKPAMTENRLLQRNALRNDGIMLSAETIGIYHSKKSEQTPFSVKYCFGVKPDNDLKSLIKCDWSK